MYGLVVMLIIPRSTTMSLTNKMYEFTFFFPVMECWEYQNKYDVADENGEQTFFLKEESSCLMRMCCANARELEVSMQGVVHQILSPISNSESTNFF